jgi:hypothetical protein
MMRVITDSHECGWYACGHTIRPVAKNGLISVHPERPPIPFHMIQNDLHATPFNDPPYIVSYSLIIETKALRDVHTHSHRYVG